MPVETKPGDVSYQLLVYVLKNLKADELRYSGLSSDMVCLLAHALSGAKQFSAPVAAWPESYRGFVVGRLKTVLGTFEITRKGEDDAVANLAVAWLRAVETAYPYYPPR